MWAWSRLNVSVRRMARFATAFIDRLLESLTPASFAELLAIIEGGAKYNRQDPTRGLPEPLFLFSEVLHWTACSFRSGVWTYYEATSIKRQQAVLERLLKSGPHGLARQYHEGMRSWQDKAKMAVLDTWLGNNEEEINRWLHDLLSSNRAVVHEYCA